MSFEENFHIHPPDEITQQQEQHSLPSGSCCIPHLTFSLQPFLSILFPFPFLPHSLSPPTPPPLWPYYGHARHECIHLFPPPPPQPSLSPSFLRINPPHLICCRMPLSSHSARSCANRSGSSILKATLTASQYFPCMRYSSNAVDIISCNAELVGGESIKQKRTKALRRRRDERVAGEGRVCMWRIKLERGKKSSPVKRFRPKTRRKKKLNKGINQAGVEMKRRCGGRGGGVCM